MRINYVSTKTSIKLVLILGGICAFFTAGWVWAYYCFTMNNPSLADFFSWTGLIIRAFWAEPDLNIFEKLFILSFPIFLYIGLISAFINRFRALVKLKNSLKLKYVEFLPEKIQFVFFKPEINFACGYSDIENLELVIFTHWVRTKSGSYIAPKELILKFTILNNKTFELVNIPVNYMSLIYSIIDYSRNIKSFSHKFEGVGEVQHIKEKIEDYRRAGIKQILTSQEETICKMISLIFFTLGLFFIFGLYDSIVSSLEHGYIGIVIFAFAPILLSFICDIVYYADKLKERKYNHYGK